MPVAISGNLTSGSEVVEGQAFTWAMSNNADVICCCWGPPVDGQPHPMPRGLSDTVTKAATQGRNGKGCVIVFASGNGTTNMNLMDLDGWASHPNVIAVGACDAAGTRSFSSVFGQALWCLAPGQSTSADGQTFPIESATTSGYTNFLQEFEQTSAAAAQVAGVVALMISARPDLNAAQVKQIISATCDKTPHRPGEGPYDAGRSLQQGFGRVNAAAAVTAATIFQGVN
jgi:subtilisin family serine protease